MQDHARGLLSGDKVDTKLYDLMFESLEFQRTLESLSSAREEIRNQSHEVCGNHFPLPPSQLVQVRKGVDPPCR